MLMPVYAADLELQSGWVDGSGFPSQSATQPFAGAAPPVQQLWDTLHGVGINVLRVGVDISAPDAAVQLANLVVWAQGAGALLVPVLQAGPPASAVSPGYPAAVAALVRAVVASLRSGDGHYLQAYARILAYQLESEANIPSHHGRVAGATMQLRLLQAAAALRRAEREALAETGLAATPIQVSASFDAELVRAGAGPGLDLGDQALTQATANLTGFLTELAAAPDIDVFNVAWFPGSFSAGGVDRFAALIRALIAALPGKQLSLTTGQSTTFAPETAQRDLLALAFANLADLRASLGQDASFTGLYVRGAIAAPAVPPPSGGMPAAVASWDWRTRTGELARAWNGEDVSPELLWWERAVAAGFGVVALGSNPDGSPSLTPRAGFSALTAVATSANQAAQPGAGALPSGGTAPQTAGAIDTGVSPQVTPFETQGYPTTPGLGQALTDTAKQGVVNILARFLDALGNSFSFQGAGAAPAGGYSGYGTQPTYEPTPATGFGYPTPGAPWPPPQPSEPLPTPQQGEPSPPPQPGEPSPTPTEPTVAPGGLNVTPAPGGATPLGGALQTGPCGPKLQDISAGGGGAAGSGSAQVTLVNPCQVLLPGYRVVLLAGGKIAATTLVAPLMPHQTRSLMLDNVVLPAGQSIAMTAEVHRKDGGGAAMTSLIKRVDLTPKTKGTPSLSGVTTIGHAAGTTAGTTAVRSTLPTTALTATRIAQTTALGSSGTTSAAQVRSMGGTGVASGTAPTQAPTRPLELAARPLPVAAGVAQPQPAPTPTSPAIRSSAPFVTGRMAVGAGPATQASPTPAAGTQVTQGGATTVTGGALARKPGVLIAGAHPNLALAAADVNTGRPGKPGDPWTITVIVHNAGAAPARGAQAVLILHADGKVVARKEITVDVPAGGAAPLTWLTRVPAGGRLQVEVGVGVAGEVDTSNNHVLVNVPMLKPLILMR
jgi:hypothetical protein